MRIARGVQVDYFERTKGEVLMLKTWKTGGLVALLLMAWAGTASATPNMIRLGYEACTSCHLSPQGGGLLTPYGVGIDAAQNLRPQDLGEEFDESARRWLSYDVKLSLGLDRTGPAATGYGFSTSVRTAVGYGKNRLVYGGSVSSPTLTRARTSGAVSMRMSRLYWLFQATEKTYLTVGRDDLPSGGTGGASFSRRVTSPDVSSTPSQVKMYWSNDRWQVTGYGFGPDGNETAPRFEAVGGGAVIGRTVWKNHAVAGVTTRISKADAYDRRAAGAFLRLGITEHWGILLEHEVTDRITDRGAQLTHLAGRTEIFYVPFDWLQTALTADHVTTAGGARQVRFSPSVEARLNRNISLSFNTRDVLNGGTASGRTRTYSMQLTVKTVE
jgi:hypothetical protein